MKHNHILGQGTSVLQYSVEIVFQIYENMFYCKVCQNGMILQLQYIYYCDGL